MRGKGKKMAHFLELLLKPAGHKDRSQRNARIALVLLAVLALALLAANFKAVLAAFSEMGAYLQYKFIQRALIVGVLVALCAALLGVTLCSSATP